MYYLKSDYKLLGYEKSKKKDKKYDAIIQNKKTKKIIRIPSGNIHYKMYRDLTGLNLYPNLIHNDKERRKRYRARAKSLVKDDYYSPSWFSYYITW